jgi:hypothetical protein
MATQTSYASGGITAASRNAQASGYDGAIDLSGQAGYASSFSPGTICPFDVASVMHTLRDWAAPYSSPYGVQYRGTETDLVPGSRHHADVAQMAMLGNSFSIPRQVHGVDTWVCGLVFGVPLIVIIIVVVLLALSLAKSSR